MQLLTTADGRHEAQQLANHYSGPAIKGESSADRHIRGQKAIEARLVSIALRAGKGHDVDAAEIAQLGAALFVIEERAENDRNYAEAYGELMEL